ncbi:MAG TPA: ribosome maturation factor RimP [Syntrophomonadaceae bacterium]|nr:ribosome maturation factor RimP [Syntrophomonadaceae bacterium]HQA06900.1 ribosome maturation factor RimP [Syntrophomonadaceae bacterium]HQE22716.1 ribosome maturation factor RimP [Syntrophomonadaceae bacterium]
MAESQIDSIAQKIAEPIGQLQAELVEVEYRRENGDQYLRIFIDRETGVDLDLCSRVSRTVKDIIDAAGIEYDHLEVSSPGLDRKLIHDRDFVRFNGQPVKVKLAKRFNGPRQVVGVLIGHNELTLTVKNEEGVFELPRSEITVVRLHPEL